MVWVCLSTDFTDVTYVNLADGISRHRLTPYAVDSVKYNSPSHGTVRFPVPVKMNVGFKVI